MQWPAPTVSHRKGRCNWPATIYPILSSNAGECTDSLRVIYSDSILLSFCPEKSCGGFLSISTAPMNTSERCGKGEYSTLFGHRMLLFDLGGTIAAVRMFAMAIVVTVRHTAELYRQEPLASTP